MNVKAFAYNTGNREPVVSKPASHDIRVIYLKQTTYKVVYIKEEMLSPKAPQVI